MSAVNNNSSKVLKVLYNIRFLICFLGIMFYLSPLMVAGDFDMLSTLFYLIALPIFSAVLTGFLMLFGIIWRATYRYIDSIGADKDYKAPLCISLSLVCILLAVYLGYSAMQHMPSLEGWNFFLPTTYFNAEGKRSAHLPSLVILVYYFALPIALMLASIKFWVSWRKKPTQAD